MDPLSLLWLFFILASLQPAAQRYLLEARRRANLEALAKKRGSTMITLIHRQESMSFFGFPLVRYIDIDDAESILRAISQDTIGPADRGPRMGHELLSFKQTNVREADVGAQVPVRMCCRPNWQQNNE